MFWDSLNTKIFLGSAYKKIFCKIKFSQNMLILKKNFKLLNFVLDQILRFYIQYTKNLIHQAAGYGNVNKSNYHTILAAN